MKRRGSQAAAWNKKKVKKKIEKSADCMREERERESGFFCWELRGFDGKWEMMRLQEMKNGILLSILVGKKKEKEEKNLRRGEGDSEELHGKEKRAYFEIEWSWFQEKV